MEESADKMNDNPDLEEERARLAKAMESLGGAMIHSHNNILNNVFGHLSLLGREFGENEAAQARIETVEDDIDEARLLVERYMFMLRQPQDAKNTAELPAVCEDFCLVVKPLLHPAVDIDLEFHQEGAATVLMEHQLLLRWLVCLGVCLYDSGCLDARLMIQVRSEFEGSCALLMLADKGSGDSVSDLNDTVDFIGRRIEQAGGHLVAELATDNVELKIKLPTLDANDTAAITASTGPHIAAESAGAGSPSGVILLIDTNTDRAHRAKQLIEEAGFAVLEIETSSVALQIFKAQPDLFRAVIVADESKEAFGAFSSLVAQNQRLCLIEDGEWPSSPSAWLAMIN